MKKQSPRVHPLDFPAVQALILEIQALEGRAHRLLMLKTAHALNEAMNKAGWELADEVEAAQSAPAAAARDRAASLSSEKHEG